MQRFGHRLLGGILLAVCLCAPLAARQAVLTLNDGRRITGEFVREDDKKIVISIAKQEVTYDRDKVATVKFLEDARERYARERAKLKDDDIDGRFILAYDMFEAGELTLAKKEADELVALKPDDRRVVALAQAINAKIKPVKQAGGADDKKPPAKAADPNENRSKPMALKGKTLTEDDINLIRVYEIDLKERPPVTVSNDVVEDFFKDFRESEYCPKGSAAQQKFRRLKGYEKLDYFFRARARPLYSRVQVKRDPPALAKFRTKIHNAYVVDYCGAVKCHGGKEMVGGLQLFHDTRNRTEYVYTNFFLLDRYETPTGYMINRNNPEKSLLLQYGLKRDAATMPHPDVPGWRAEFRNDQMPAYKNIIGFINELYNNPRPDYGVQLDEPEEEDKEGGDEDADEKKAAEA